MILHRLILLAVVLSGMSFWGSDEANAQWRTRYVHRDGLFHVEKYRTGNGITPAFANVLQSAIVAAPGIINAVNGRDIEEERDLATARALSDQWKQEYAQQQLLANQLLIRTAGLVNADLSGLASTPTPPLTPQAGTTPAPGTGGATGVQTNEAESGPNPWKPF